MEISGIELRFLINEIDLNVSQGYYVSDIISVTRDSLLFKLHHPIQNEIMLLISTKGPWISSKRFVTLEENPLESVLKRELLRAKITSISQEGSERIFMINFVRIDGTVRVLIVEIFGSGNIIVCNENLNIIGIQRPIEVRHRSLKTGMRYTFPPKRGGDALNISLDYLLGDKKDQNVKVDLSRWIGNCTSLPRKFVEEIIKRSNLKTKLVGELSYQDINMIFLKIKEVVNEVLTLDKHSPIVTFDDDGHPVDAFPINLPISAIMQKNNMSSYMEAVDLVLSNEILDSGKNLKTFETDKEISSLQHDLDAQKKAKEEVLIKANTIRKLAADLNHAEKISDISDQSLSNIFNQNNVQLIREKGLDIIEIMDEKFRFLPNLPKLASIMYSRAKDMERGSITIDEASDKIRLKIEKLRSETEKVHSKIIFKQQENKEWYERYRWWITTEGFLVVGGRDSSSNSAIIRKHMEDNDIVYHAEIHGSPFFIIKGGRDKVMENSLKETAQATASFSRAWKDGLSSADSYWVFPEQVRKGAPTGQFLPKGAFVIEGKRNYVHGIEIVLALGITEISNKNGKKYVLFSGPPESIKNKSIVYATLLPGGLDPMSISKKIKSEFVKEISGFNPDLANFVKTISIDDFIRTLPSGPSKIHTLGRGEF